MCFTCSQAKVKIGPKSDVVAGQMVGIPLNGVLRNDFFTLIAWAWCINPEKVKAAFKAQTGLDIDDKDFATLVKASASGADFAVHKVKFIDVVNSIYFTPEERNQASCKILLTT